MMDLLTTFLQLLMAFLSILIITLHSLGIYLLKCIRKNGHQNVEQIYLMHLSGVEIVVGISMLIHVPLHTVYLVDGKPVHILDLWEYISVMKTVFVYVTYFIVMIVLTVDKLLVITLNIRYPVHWNEVKAKKLMLLAWFLGVVFGLTTTIIKALKKFETVELHFIYIPLNIVFVLVAIVTYTILFYKYVQSRICPLPASVSNQDAGHQSVFKIFRRSRFLITTMLIISFMLFTVLPQLCLVFVKNIHIFVFICFQISMLCDVFIYVLLTRQIRVLLWKKLGF